MENLSGEKFLDKLYQDLYMSDMVQHTKKSSDTRLEAIKKYLERLERVHKVANSKDRKELITRLYIRKYVIKDEYLKWQIQRRVVVNGQIETLTAWIDFLYDEKNNFPLWAKYWAFQGMLKMSSYSDNNGTYLTREKDTIAPFIDANPEIITSCIEYIMKIVNQEELTDEELNSLNKTNSFKKIYTYFERKYRNNVVEKSDSTDGIWVKYEGKEEALKLVNDLKYKNTGWCTASSTLLAKNQLSMGNFYVYFTKNKNGEYKIPRIAIRFNNEKIEEIRGIGNSQNLEECMIPNLEKQLREMSFLADEDVNKYMEIVNGLKELDEIYEKTIKKEELTKEEIENLYSKHYGFGFSNEPRVEKIIGMRNKVEDFDRISNVKVKEIFLFNNYIPEKYINDESLIRELLDYNAAYLRYASDVIRDNESIVLLAIRQSGLSLRFASDRLKGEKRIALEAVKNSPGAFAFIDKKLWHDEDIIKATYISNKNGQYVFDEFFNDMVSIEDYKNDKNFIEISKKFPFFKNNLSVNYSSKLANKYNKFKFEKTLNSLNIFDINFGEQDLKNNKAI